MTAEDLQEFRASVRGVLARHSGMSVVRALMATEDGYDPALWTEAARVGLPGLTIPERFGGGGFTAVEQGAALEELGRSLFVGPYLSSGVLATNLVLHSDDESLKQELLPSLAAGATRATAALAERSWEQGVERPAVRAYALGTGWSLVGSKNLVLDGHTADVLIVSAATAEGVGLFLVDGAASGLTRRAAPVVDLTRKLAVVEFESTPARLIAGHPAGWRRALDLTVAGLAAEQVGAADRALELAVDYLKVREQFGRPLASFQALKHRAADHLVQIEAARAVTHAALAAGAAERWAELDTLAALAKLRSWQVLDAVSADSIQMHGAVGFTWEYDPHLYFKRARGNQFLFGDPARYRDRAAANVGL